MATPWLSEVMAEQEESHIGFPFFVSPDNKPAAVFLYTEKPTGVLALALERVRKSTEWSFMQFEATPEVCESFQCVRFPRLVLYNTAGEETAARVGDVGVQELVAEYF